MTDPDQIHDFADRALREALEDTDNLRAVLRRIRDEIAGRIRSFIDEVL